MRYADLESVVDDFCGTLALGLPASTPTAVPGNPSVYAHRVDYPPFGAGGKGRFIVTLLDRGAELELLTLAVAAKYLD